MKYALIALVAVTLASCGKQFEKPVGYLTIPIYQTDINNVNATKAADIESTK
jgi:hypothetical protein